VNEAEEDLKAVAESIAGDAERLQAVEEAKVDTDAEDPRMASLVDESERLIEGIRRKGAAQTVLAEQAARR
jgi:hypothetical protein